MEFRSRGGALRDWFAMLQRVLMATMGPRYSCSIFGESYSLNSADFVHIDMLNTLILVSYVLIKNFNWGKMVVAITGATGFIGSRLVDRLVAGMKPYYLPIVFRDFRFRITTQN